MKRVLSVLLISLLCTSCLRYNIGASAPTNSVEQQVEQQVEVGKQQKPKPKKKGYKVDPWVYVLIVGSVISIGIATKAAN